MNNGIFIVQERIMRLIGTDQLIIFLQEHTLGRTLTGGTRVLKLLRLLKFMFKQEQLFKEPTQTYRHTDTQTHKHRREGYGKTPFPFLSKIHRVISW